MADTENTEKKAVFNEQKDLNETERKLFDHAKKRIFEMQSYREQDHYGVKLDSLWADADQAYIPHRLKKSRKRVIVEDEARGWRGNLVDLGSSDWQSDIAMANPFVKMQVALSVLVDQNPTGVFTATAKKFKATTELMKQLYQRSWEYARSKGQLKLFVHNLMKYGWAVGRTYPLRIERKVRQVTAYNLENPDEIQYEEKTVVEFNDIMRESLDVRNVWLDDMAKPNAQFSIRDWSWRRVYTMDDFKEEFGKYEMVKKGYVQPGGNTDETINKKKGTNETTSTDKIEVLFYESRLKDLFMVIANGVPVVVEPLPVSDGSGVKKLSCWQTYWNIRHASSPYGIGIYEAIRYDQAFLDRIRNMTVDQLTMSIYKMFFYSSTSTLTDTGDIKIAPGVGKQVMNPKDINWLEVPGPGADAYKGLEMFKKDVDEASGITEPLLGEVTGKTAFELAQAKEAAIKRLKTPLDNVLDALNDEGYVTISLIQLLYSIPETYEISDPVLIEDYLKEIQSDPDLYERNVDTDETGLTTERFTAKVYPEFPLKLDKDEQGNLIETKENSFFRVKPEGLKWEGIINIKSQSVLSPSKQIEKALGLEMYQIVNPMLQQVEQERLVALQAGQPNDLDSLAHGKALQDLIRMYDKDPRDIIPSSWFESIEMSQPLFVEEAMAQQMPPMSETRVSDSMQQQAQVQPTGVSSQPQGMANKMMGMLSKPFRGV